MEFIDTEGGHPPSQISWELSKRSKYYEYLSFESKDKTLFTMSIGFLISAIRPRVNVHFHLKQHHSWPYFRHKRAYDYEEGQRLFFFFWLRHWTINPLKEHSPSGSEQRYQCRYTLFIKKLLNASNVFLIPLAYTTIMEKSRSLAPEDSIYSWGEASNLLKSLLFSRKFSETKGGLFFSSKTLTAEKKFTGCSEILFSKKFGSAKGGPYLLEQKPPSCWK